MVKRQARCRAPRSPGRRGEAPAAVVRREKVGGTVRTQESPRGEDGGGGKGWDAQAVVGGRFVLSAVNCFLFLPFQNYLELALVHFCSSKKG